MFTPIHQSFLFSEILLTIELHDFSRWFTKIYKSPCPCTDEVARNSYLELFLRTLLRKTYCCQTVSSTLLSYRHAQNYSTIYHEKCIVFSFFLVERESNLCICIKILTVASSGMQQNLFYQQQQNLQFITLSKLEITNLANM